MTKNVVGKTWILAQHPDGSNQSIPPANLGPYWAGVPAPRFVQGVASSYPLSAFALDPEGDAITHTSSGTAFAGAGVSAVGQSLQYDGVGPVATIVGSRLTATSTGGSAQSAPFNIVIEAAAAATSAEQDWISRSTGPGVVWAHDFRNQAELDNFLWANTDRRFSGVMPRIANDGPTGKCLEYVALGASVVGNGTTTTFGTSDTTLVIDDATYWPTGDFYFYIAPPPGGYPAKRNNLFYCPAGGRSGNTLSGLVYQTSVAGFIPCSAVREAWPAGSIAGHHVEQTWNRPFCAFQAPGNGKTSNDVNNAGVPMRVWSKLADTPANALYGFGWYGRSEYAAQYTAWQPLNGPGGSPMGAPRANPFEGTEFYIQFRVKIDPRFWDYHTPPDALTTNSDGTWGHKLLFIQSQSTVPQQLVPVLVANNKYNIPSTRTAPFQWYTTQAGRNLSSNLDGSGSFQPGSSYAATAIYAASNLPAGSAWEWIDGEWVTCQIRVKPGLHWDRTANPSATGVRNTILEVKVCRDGQPYTTIFSQADQAISYGSTNDSQGEFFNALPGYCAFIPTMYLNVDLGATPPKRSYYHRFTQIIFSKQEIPAPSFSAPLWFVNAPSGQWSQIAGAGTMDAVKPSPLPQAQFTGGGSGQFTGLFAWAGSSIDIANKEYLVTANGGHADYAGNEQYALSLNQAVPAWRRMNDPTPNNRMQFNPDNSTGSFLDGRPKAMHNCFQVFVNGKVWMIYQNSVTSGNGGNFNRIVAFNRQFAPLVAADGSRATGGSGAPLPHTEANLGPWEIYGSIPSVGDPSFGKPVYNSRDGFIYGLGGKSGGGNIQYWRVDPATGVTSAMQYASGVGSVGRFNSWAVCIPEIGSAGAILAHDADSGQIGVLDCSKFGQADAWVAKSAGFTGTAYSAPDTFGGGDGVYISAFRQVAVGNPPQIGGRIYRLQLPAGVTTVAALVAGSWAWNNFVPLGAGSLGSPGPGSWGRWQHIPDMGNGQGLIIYVDQVNQPTYVYKIPAGGLP